MWMSGWCTTVKLDPIPLPPTIDSGLLPPPPPPPPIRPPLCPISHGSILSLSLSTPLTIEAHLPSSLSPSPHSMKILVRKLLKLKTFASISSSTRRQTTTLVFRRLSDFRVRFSQDLDSELQSFSFTFHEGLATIRRHPKTLIQHQDLVRRAREQLEGGSRRHQQRGSERFCHFPRFSLPPHLSSILSSFSHLP